MSRLARPHVRFHRSFLAAMEEFAEDGRTGDDSVMGSDLAAYAASWRSASGFAAYVDRVLAERERPAKPGFVCASTWWWVEDQEYVGRVVVRHGLTPQLLEVGGHIGYDVRPTRRREGQATAMLAAVLPEAAALGIDPALVTCSVDNLGSRRAIEANGGVLEDQRGQKLRFWLTTLRVGG